MKKRDLESKLNEIGCQLVRHGGKHDFWTQPKTGKSQPVPRHKEINEYLARKILRFLDPENESL